MLDSNSKNNLNIAIVEIPTFMEHFVKSNEPITLIFRKASATFQNQEDSINEICDIVNGNDINKTDLDLTGTPLELDLQSNNDIVDITFKAKQPNHWRKAEEQYTPTSLRDARRNINTHASETAITMNICDGLNNRKVICLGCDSKTNTRFEVKIGEMLLRQHEEIQLLNQKHKKNCNFPSDVIDTKITNKYSIIGWDMIIDPNNLEAVAPHSALIDVSWNQPNLEPRGMSLTDILLCLQVYAGHDDSLFAACWEELKLLSIYIAHLINGEEMLPVDNGLEENELNDELCKLLTDSGENVMNEELNLSNYKRGDDFRSMDLLDKLWKIFKRTKDISSVRDGMVFLFEEFVELGVNYHTPDDNFSTVGTILSRLSDGRLAVPTISEQTALNYLAELGIQKVKKDYLVLLNYFDRIDFDSVTTYSKTVFCNREMNGERLPQPNSRKSRLSRKSMGFNRTELMDKLDFLARMHVTTEFLFLGKCSKLDDDSFHALVQSVYSNYLKPRRDAITFAELEQEPLCVVDISLSNFDANLLSRFRLIFCKIEFTSKTKDESVTSMFLLSTHPILPETIYKYTDLDPDSDYEVYYAVEGTFYREL